MPRSSVSVPHGNRPRKRVPGPVLAGLLCLLAAALLAACGGNENKAKRERVVPVTAVAAVRENVPVTLSAVGNVTPLASVEIKSRVGGIIVKQLVQNGQDVEAGDLLFQVDPRSFDLAIKEAQARLDRDRAHLNKAKEDLRRYSKLRELNVVAQESYDNTFAEATSLENTIRLNEAALEQARLDRDYAAIRAPISGRVGIVQVNVGNVIKANDDRTLCVINQIRPINVSFTLPERYLGEIMERRRQGPMRVSITPSGMTSTPVDGDLAAVDNAVDTTTGTIRLLASYPNDDTRFWPGQFARVELTLRTLKDALLLPTGAVLQGMDGPYVYVVKTAGDDPASGTVEPRQVVTAHIVGKRTVIRSGIEPGDMVVLDGQVGLSPGAKVSIKNMGKNAAKADGKGAAGTPAKAPAEDKQ
ncbi:efflux transporter, RND family, MFP subunit [Pseudodesulfovibrio mercurii]|uniref:Efflux transporter, RND family, MFP subunit n=1 Tax=Pseudodesulfovibrio mercurii TaxID=641491 RepID=F0JK45_9BACT|nr:efflux RND transporter periplasmic adaptor subunit [Pseudodesulfovibrio mercurii]EGB16294.1 efflux transporter, RND family, MFP subunit [Pseudodesulfovibrio mercurii]